MTLTSLNSTIEDDVHEITWSRILIGVILYIVVLLTILGNTMVLVAVAKNKKLQTVFNFYVINLAITDIAVAVAAMSFYTTNNILGYWPFGEFLCGVWIFFDYGMTFASVFTLIVISVDRFWSVTWSVHYRAHHTKRKCVKLIIAIWVFMLVLWLPPCIMDRVNNTVPNKCIWEPSKNKEFVVVVATLGHHGSFVILLTCYLRVFYVLMKRSKVGTANHSKNNSPNLRRPPKIAEVNTNDDDTRSSHEPSHDSIADHSSVSHDKNHKPNIWTTSNEDQGHILPKTKMYGVHLEPIIPKVGEVQSIQSIHVEGSSSNTCNDKLHRENSNSKRSEERKYERHERRVFKTLTYIIVGYVLCWLPFHIVFDISAASPKNVPPLVYTVTFWLTYINSTINPFLYNFSSVEFRNAFKDLLCKKRTSTP